MATEVLAIPEERLREVIDVIRCGIAYAMISEDTFEHLSHWCEEMEEYLSDDS